VPLPAAGTPLHNYIYTHMTEGKITMFVHTRHKYIHILVCNKLSSICINVHDDFQVLNISWKYLIKLCTKFRGAAMAESFKVSFIDSTSKAYAYALCSLGA
jgi:hypothetical protein